MRQLPDDRPSLFASVRAWWAADHGFRGKLTASAVAGVAVIILLTAVFHSVTTREEKTDEFRDSTLQVLRVVDRSEDDLIDLEVLHRRHLATGEMDLLDQFKRRRQSLHSRLEELSALVADQPDQLQQITWIKEKIDLWKTTIVQPQVAMRERAGDATALPLQQKAITHLEGIRFSLARFGQQQAEIFKQSNDVAARQRRWQTSGFALLALLAIGAFLATSAFSYRALQRHLRQVENARARTRLIIDTTLDGVLTMDEGGLILLANPAAERLFGAPANSIVGRHIADLLPQRTFAEPLAKFGRGTVTADARRLDSSRATFPAEISLSEMKVEGQRQHVALVRDITERRRNEEALRHIGLGVGAATGEAFVKSFVAELCRALRIDCAFFVECEGEGTEVQYLLTVAEQGLTRDTAPCQLENTACQDALVHGCRVLTRDARAEFPEDWLLATYSAESFIALPLISHDGTIAGLIGVLDHRPMEQVELFDSILQIFATRAAAELERKRYERSLAEEKERLAVTLRSIGDGCVTIDNRGRILLMNPVAELLTGWHQQDVIGWPLGEVFQFVDERTRRPCHKAVKSLIEHGSAKELTRATLIIAIDGAERVVETNAAPIRDPADRKIGAVLVFRDVTERNRAVEERQKAEKLESLGVAAGGIAHDFNNLLTAILGNLSLVLFNPKLESGMRESLTSAKKASIRAQDLAQQLLTFAKGGAPIKQTASIAQLVHDTVTFSLRGSNVRSEFTIPEDLWVAEVDAGQISQVVQNLVINADQAMPAGGTVRVGCANVELHHENPRLGLAAGRYLKITVQDEGIGIPEEHLKKIFDPYFTTKPKGSGLGLATSYSIIKSHGGVIEVVSQAGEGTCFYIFLPATEKALDEAEQLEGSSVEHKAARVLVLDDEEAICALVACALEPLGYEVVEARDALTAIRLYEEALLEGRRFDVVISDLTIPGGMGGHEAVRRLRELDPTVRAIVSSGYATDPVMSEFEAHGFCAMIAKPYEIDALGRKVAEVLARPGPENVICHDFLAMKTA